MNRISIILFAIALFLFKKSFAQEDTLMTLVKGADGLYSYEHVFEMPGKTKDDIFLSLKNWVIKNVITQSNTNYFDDAGKNTVSTATSLSTWEGCIVSYKLNIDIKEGKYKVSGTSFYLSIPGGVVKKLGDYSDIGNNVRKKNRQKILDDTNSFFSKMIVSMRNSVKSESKSDW